MNVTTRRSLGYPANKQTGFVLVTVLIFMVVLTMIGVASMRTTRVQEQIAGSRYERITAMAASQAALSDGIDYISQGDFESNSGAFRVRSVNNIIGTTKEGWSIESWVTANTDWYGGPDALPLGAGNGKTYTLNRVHQNPAFIVDRMADQITQLAQPVPVYRVTARGEGGRVNAAGLSETSAILQGIMRLPSREGVN